LPAGEGLLLRPAPSIHTAFMRFPIDVVFLDGDLRIVKLVTRMKPWHTSAARRAKSVLELAAGEIGRRGLALSDTVALVDPATAETGAAPQTRVLLVAADRRFRAVASALLTRRGFSVIVRDRSDDLAADAAHERAEVVVLDATPSLTAAAHEAARLQALRPPIGFVAVGDEPQDGLSALPVLPKWGSFVSLFAAIEQARPRDRRQAAEHAPL
jgi:hypothetical protein